MAYNLATKKEREEMVCTTMWGNLKTLSESSGEQNRLHCFIPLEKHS